MFNGKIGANFSFEEGNSNFPDILIRKKINGRLAFGLRLILLLKPLKNPQELLKRPEQRILKNCN